MVGQQIGRYRISREIGRGAMGVVYSALDPVIGRTVAIKTIHFAGFKEGTSAAELRDRLRREAQAAGILSHPGIITIHDIGNEGDEAYIVMEYVDGRTLEEVFASGVPQHTTVLLGVLKKAAEALDYAHSRGIVHRDIKPSNIMVARDGAVKIADFGVAKFSASTSMTQTGFVLGTPNYMSPEQAQARTLDGRSDQFSLAVLAYRVLTGMLPFTAPTLTAVLTKLLWEQPEFSQTGLHPTLQSVLAKALAKDPSQRYASCLEFVTQLERAYLACRPDVPAYEEGGVAASEPDPAQQTYLIPPASRNFPPVPYPGADPAEAHATATGFDPPAAGNEDETATSFTGTHNYSQPAAPPPPPPPPPVEEEMPAALPRRRPPVIVIVAALATLAVGVLLIGYTFMRRGPGPAVPAAAAGQVSAPQFVAQVPETPPEPPTPAVTTPPPAAEPAPAAPAKKTGNGVPARPPTAKKPKPAPAAPEIAPPVAPVLQPPAVIVSETPHPASPKPAPPPAPAPATGVVKWTGRMQKNAVLVINSAGASFGSAAGLFPGIPIKIEVEPASVTVRELPGPGNGWKQLMLYSGSERYSSITIHWTALQ